ncbi:MAG: hypothetical protein LBN06_02855 [Prevotellaceae bacterium]|jgi:hypothetical protein|nr:hypothetical protein [Prevotellaceae bacterium]
MIKQTLRDTYISEAMSFVHDEALIEQALHALQNVRKQQADGTCGFAIKELHERIEQAEKSIQGGNTYTTEELRKRHPICD